jgi:hypothetical protein
MSPLAKNAGLYEIRRYQLRNAALQARYFGEPEEGLNNFRPFT